VRRYAAAAPTALLTLECAAAAAAAAASAPLLLARPSITASASWSVMLSLWAGLSLGFSSVSSASVRLRRAADAAVNLGLRAKLLPAPLAALNDLLLPLLLLLLPVAREARAAERRLAAVEAARSRIILRLSPSALLPDVLRELLPLLPLLPLSWRPSCSCLPTF
jgi:hypothetical protein